MSRVGAGLWGLERLIEGEMGERRLVKVLCDSPNLSTPHFNTPFFVILL